MALSSTVYRFKIDMSHVDRGIYEVLDLRVACHPSETHAFLLTRVIAYALFYEEGIAFSKGGLSSSDEAAITVRSLDGILKTIIEIGSPAPDRLHKATKAAERVIVVTQHDPELLLRDLSRATIHRATELEIYSLPKSFLAELGENLDRHNDWQLVFTDGEIYITTKGKEAGGEFRMSPKFGPYFIWPETLKLIA